MKASRIWQINRQRKVEITDSKAKLIFVHSQQWMKQWKRGALYSFAFPRPIWVSRASWRTSMRCAERCYRNLSLPDFSPHFHFELSTANERKCHCYFLIKNFHSPPCLPPLPSWGFRNLFEKSFCCYTCASLSSPSATQINFCLLTKSFFSLLKFI